MKCFHCEKKVKELTEICNRMCCKQCIEKIEESMDSHDLQIILKKRGVDWVKIRFPQDK